MPEARAKDLHSWMTRPEFEDLLRVCEAQVKAAECTALREAMQTKTSPMKIDLSNIHLIEAQDWQSVVDKLKKLQGQTGFEYVNVK